MNDEILVNIYNTIQEFWPLLVGIGVILGLILFGYAFIKLYSSSRNGATSWFTSIALIIGAIFLLNTQKTLDLFSVSVLGRESDFSFAASVNAGPGQAYMLAAIACIKMIGMFGFIRGGYLLGQSQNNSATFWAGMVHCLGGTLAMNIETFAIMLGNTLGGTFGSTINSLFGG